MDVLDTRIVEGARVNLASHIVSVPVPWTELAVLVGGSVAITFITTAAALLLLRAATDPSELRAAA